MILCKKIPRSHSHSQPTGGVPDSFPRSKNAGTLGMSFENVRTSSCATRVESLRH